MSVKRFIGLLMLAIFGLYTACYITLLNMPVTGVFNEEKPVKVSSETVVRRSSKYNEKEADLLNFIEKHFTGEDGEIFTNVKTSGNETLSESAGLLMSYSVLSGRKDLFGRTYSYLKSNLLVDNRYIKWKEGKEETTCNAAIDDLRIVRALLDAYDKWGIKEYYDAAGFIQEAIYSNQIVEDNLCELYDWKYNKVRNSIPLSYLDLYTMDRLRNFNKSWTSVVDKGLITISNGRMAGTPFFNKYLNYDNGMYVPDEEFYKGKGICLTYTIYTVLHLAQMNENTSFFSEWLKKEMDKGKLYAWYNPHTLKPVQNIESTAVYALAAIYSKRIGEDELCSKLLDRMLKFMVTDKESPYYGGFGNDKTGEFYSFDNLTALWALAIGP